MKMGKILISIFSLLLISSCDGDINVGEIGIDSDLNGNFLPYFDGKIGPPQGVSRPVAGSFTTGVNIYSDILGTVEYQEEDNGIDELFRISPLFEMDSVLLINSDSTLKLVYIRPTLDDSNDLNAKSEIHLWNPNNWYQNQKTKDFFFEVRQSHFENFGEDI